MDGEQPARSCSDADKVRKNFGGALRGVQEGRAPTDAKSLKGKIKGAMQLAADHDGDTYRTVYTARLDDIVYVLHCFQKRSKRGAATPQVDIDLIEHRLQHAKALHEERKRNTP